MSSEERRPASAWSPTGWPSERPSADRSALEIWCYTDRFSYRPGERVDVHVHTTAATYGVRVVRDGARPQEVDREAPERATTIWDAHSVNRPGAHTIGLTGMAGSYSRYGAAVPRSSGSYTVYRPEHWAFAGTDLYYGDLFGGAPICVAAFELDAVQYTFRRGLPYPTFEDGAPETLEILAMAPAVMGEQDRWGGEIPLGGSELELRELLAELGPDTPPFLSETPYGAGMVATFTRGRGIVFNAGSTEWVNGLTHRDPFTERITRNVLDNLSAGATIA
jgi:hypothetical protein